MFIRIRLVAAILVLTTSHTPSDGCLDISRTRPCRSSWTPRKRRLPGNCADSALLADLAAWRSPLSDFRFSDQPGGNLFLRPGVSKMKECVMFCDHCGSPLHPTSQFCSACGKPVIPLPSLSPTLSRPVQSEDRVRRHINRLAILWLANGVLRLMLVLWFFGASRYSMPPVFGP